MAAAKTPANIRAVAEDALKVASQAADNGNKDFAKKAAVLASISGAKGKQRRVSEATIIYLEPGTRSESCPSGFVDILPHVDIKRGPRVG